MSEMNMKRPWTCLQPGDPPPCGRTLMRTACKWWYEGGCRNMKWRIEWEKHRAVWLEARKEAEG